MMKHPDYARPDQTVDFLLFFNLLLWAAALAGVLILEPALFLLPLAGGIVALLALGAHWREKQLPY